MREYKKLLLKLSILFAFFIVIFLGTKGIIKKLEPTSILEIPNTRVYENSPELGFVAAKRYSMIINPPKDSEKLRELMLDYCKKNKQMIENMGGYKSDIKNTQYVIRFYKEGWGFSRKWKPDVYEPSISDLMQSHANYCLGSVNYESNGSDVIQIAVKEWVGDEIEYKEYTVPISFLTE